MQVEQENGCPNDFVEIRDGSTLGSPLMIRLCGATLASDKSLYLSGGNTLLVHLHTDSNNNHRGFIASHTGRKLSQKSEKHGPSHN